MKMNSKPMLILLTKLIPFLWGAAILAPLLYLIIYTDMRQIVDNIWKTISELNSKLEQFISKIQDNLLDILNKIQDNLLDIIRKYSNSIDNMNSFMTNFPSISDFLQMCKNWNLFLKTLSLEELGALSHFLSSLFVLICLINIILVIYGDFMVRLLKIETRFPKLAKIIQLRRQFQLYYMLVYFIPAILTLLAVMAINAYILFG
uniref:Uncharacterized protein n=1 Tax=Schizopora paradoxa TaxID=27342 RepID=A0A5B9RDF3_9AGAM|nr:hypothetical protein Schpa_000052 [Schizopora paradoxa]QEG57210.1 hypothetical protein Schpa_000052 [Schizopora paradoxa]